jgi:maleate isomerase
MSPDGLGYRARIGLLTPNDDAVPESEFWTMAPEGVSVHVGRVLLVDPRTFADPPHPDDATALLTALPMQAIAFAFTTTGYILGPDGSRRWRPAWKSVQMAFPRFDVVYANQMGLRGLSLAQPTDPWRKFTEIYPAELYEWARTRVPSEAEAVLFSGNGFRAIGVIAALEEDLGRPVLTANQVAFWYALRQASVHASMNGYGRLFRTLNSESRPDDADA